MANESPFECIRQLSVGYYASRCLHAAAELGVADAIGEEPADLAEVARSTGTDADALRRMLRLLESCGVFQLDNGRVQHTPASRLLRANEPGSMRDFARMFGLSFNWRNTELLIDCVRTGEATLPRICPGGIWDHFNAHPEEAQVFDAAMVAKSQAFVGAILAAYDFAPFRRVVDVGGGQGHLLCAILRANPEAQGTLFDLPHVIEAAKAEGDEGGRLDFFGGSFFEDKLPAADAYLLMEVIHDWADEPAASILAAIRAAAPAGAKLLLIETEVPENREPDWSKTLDIVMLTMFAARQRTANEYRALLGAQGFELQRAIDTGAGITIFEAI